jgi:hypothetical protein
VQTDDSETAYEYDEFGKPVQKKEDKEEKPQEKAKDSKDSLADEKQALMDKLEKIRA